MSIPGPSSNLNLIRDASNSSTKACNIFSSRLSSDSDHGCQKSELVYLLTYSKADAKKFPLCQSFSSAVTKTLAQTGA